MIPLLAKTNVTPADADYPYGNIKNNGGSGDGTPVDKTVYADFHQFFERMMALSGITPNGLPDNLTNGFQLYEALLKAIKHDSWDVGNHTVMFDTLVIVGATVSFSKCNVTLNGKAVLYQLTIQLTVTDATEINQDSDIAFEINGNMKLKYKAIESTNDLADIGVAIHEQGTLNIGASAFYTDGIEYDLRVVIPNRNVVNGNTVLIRVSGAYPAF